MENKYIVLRVSDTGKVGGMPFVAWFIQDDTDLAERVANHQLLVNDQVYLITEWQLVVKQNDIALSGVAERNVG